MCCKLPWSRVVPGTGCLELSKKKRVGPHQHPFPLQKGGTCEDMEQCSGSLLCTEPRLNGQLPHQRCPTSVSPRGVTLLYGAEHPAFTSGS